MTGPDLVGLAAELKRVPAVKMVVPFGSTLHVSGTDAEALEAALTPFRARPNTVWTPAQPSLEDVFIRMMDEAPDNFDA